MNEHAGFHKLKYETEDITENNVPNNVIKEVLKKPLYLYYIKEKSGVRTLYSTHFIIHKNNQFIIKKPFDKAEIKEMLLDRGELISPYRIDFEEKEIVINNIDSIFIEFPIYEEWVDIDFIKASKQFKEKKIEILLEINSTFQS